MTLMTNVPQRRQNELLQALEREVAQRVRDSKSIEASSPQEIVTRDVLPQHDFESGDDNGATVDGTGDNRWILDWAAGGASNNSWSEAYEIDSTNQADEKIIGFMGLQFSDGDPEERRLRFLKGTGGTQGVKGWFDLESMERDEEATGVFAHSVIYGPTENGSIEYFIENALDGQRTLLLGVVGEAVGETISEPKNPLLGNSGGGRGRP